VFSIFGFRIGKLYEYNGLARPERPEPLYSFFPIYSPFKLNDDDGFSLGEDNQIQAIYVQDNALRFQLSAVLRPGRFLGNHYLAFTLPIRTFIITLDRVKEGIRAARGNKKAARLLRKELDERCRQRDATKSLVKEEEEVEEEPILLETWGNKSFLSRFVDGFVRADRDDGAFTEGIKDFFGRQGQKLTKLNDAYEDWAR
jgi:hypothetical protein